MQQQFMEICVDAVFRRSIVCYVHDAADYNSRSRFWEINYACIQSVVSLWTVGMLRNMKKVNYLID